MIWTRRKPEKAGWWWRRREKGFPESLVEVVSVGNTLSTFGGDFAGWIPISEIRSEWSSEPIEEPEEA